MESRFEYISYDGGISLDKHHELQRNQKTNINMPTDQGGFSQPEMNEGQLLDALKSKGVSPSNPHDEAKATTQSRQLTFGEKAVGLTFNPGGHAKVEAIKKAYANVIDLLNDYRIGDPGSEKNPEVTRMLSVAITESQTGQMWAVKAVTWQY